MPLCEILLMALISSEKSIIREKKLSPFHGLDLIQVIYKKSHAQPKILSSCHEIEDILGFPKNRCISEVIRSLTLILQGGIAFFAIFSTELRFFRKITRNEKKSVALPDLKRDLDFPEKSLICLINSICFHEIIHGRIFSDKSHDLSYELMSINCVGFICYNLREVEYSMFQINVY